MNKRTCELLTLRKPTKVDELCKSVPKPKNAVPKRGLPLWSHLPLESKLPVLSGPKEELIFTRDKIGKKLWQRTEQNDFILYDPNCLDVSYHYDALHDENLRPFFKNKVNRKRVYELGLITKEGDAICSLKDYNEYRRYLRRVHQDSINRERVKQEEVTNERILLRNAREEEERDLMIQSRKNIRKLKMRGHSEQLAMELQAKEDAFKASQRSYAARIRLIELKKEEDLKRRIAKSMAFEIRIRQRNRQAQKIERQRKIKALRKWHDNEVDRCKRVAKEKAKKRIEKEWSDNHHWNQKVKCQINRMARQESLLEHYRREMAILAELRSKDMEYKRLKMEDRIMKVKAEKVRHLSEHVWSIKAMVKALSKAWEDKLKFKTAEQVREEKCIIEKTIQLQMAEFKHKSEGKEVLAILQGAKRKLDKIFGLPEPVTVAVDCLLNNSITAYVKNKVAVIIAETVDKAEQFKKQYEAAMREHDRKKLVALRAQQASNAQASSPPTIEKNERVVRRASIHPNVDVIRPPTKTPSQMRTRSQTRSLTAAAKSKSQTRSVTRSLTQTPTVGSSCSVSRPQRLVSFGSIVTIDKVTEDSPTETKNGEKEDTMLVRRTKDRPPTPVPSLTELVDAAFHDPVQLESEREANVEKQNLDRQLTEFSKKLLKLVLKKADMKVENKRRNLYRQLSNLYLNTENVIAKITEVVLSTEDPNLMELMEVEHISDVLAKEVIVKRAANIFNMSPLPLPTAQPPKKISNTKVVKKLVLMDKQN